MKKRGILVLATLALLTGSVGGTSARSSSLDPGVGNIPQGTQLDATYAASNATVTNVFATSQNGVVSCYRPEVQAPFDDGPANGYTGETACPGANTGEDTGAAAQYPTQVGSNPGFAIPPPMLVKDHSESDIRVDPTNANHLIGSTKWFISAEGYNHLLGFYESFDGGSTWSVQGHIPGYEGWTDNTDPVGAFDRFGDYYELNLPYQFFYNADGTKNYTVGKSQEPNPVQPAEVISVSVRPHGSTTATQWITTHNGKPDIVASTDSVGREPDKQWITIDDNPSSPWHDRIYAMWVVFEGPFKPVPYVSYATAISGGTHTDWSRPIKLPLPAHFPQGATYLLPHVDASGNVYTTINNEDPAHQSFASTIAIDKSTDGGRSWTTTGMAASDVVSPPLIFANTTFREGIQNTFTVGNDGSLYVAYEDYSAGVTNVLLTRSTDGGATWSTPIQVNDNSSAVDEFQPNLTTAPNGTISVAFYDRRLACPAPDTSNGLALDPNHPGPSTSNYCVNASIQYYHPNLQPYGHNIRLTKQTWDPQLNSPHPGTPTGTETFIGDYFGNVADGSTDVTTFVSTYDDGTNPHHYQQQVVAKVAIP
jgi:hypothetical protein